MRESYSGKGMTGGVKPVEALRRIAFLQERAGEKTYRVRAFRGAADLIESMSPEQVEGHVRAGTLTSLPGIGKVTALVVEEALRGETPTYLRRLEDTAGESLEESAAAIRAALKGDLHSHSDWSDGGSPIREMAETARSLGHSYLALTDHSPRLTVANGLDADRLRAQLDVVAELNEELAPFRILTGIEVDILEDGSLDQETELLERLDIVVASVHSQLRMDRVAMTRRMVAAISNPVVNVLGHCTGRIVKAGGRRGGLRPESDFDAALVFDACVAYDTAIEINSRPDRLDPPKRLLRQALEAGCLFSIDSDAHAPGQLDWQRFGCERAAQCAVQPDQIVNALPVEELLKWAALRKSAG